MKDSIYKFFRAEFSAPIKSRRMCLPSVMLERALTKPLSCNFEQMKLTRLKDITAGETDFILDDPVYLPKIKEIKNEQVTVVIHFVYIDVNSEEDNALLICGMNINYREGFSFDVLEDRCIQYSLESASETFNTARLKLFCDKLSVIQTNQLENVSISIQDLTDFSSKDQKLKMIYFKNTDNKKALPEFLEWVQAK